MNYLNTKGPLVLFERALRNPAFVDKSLLVREINYQMESGNNYVCITKPRRFGKTTNANMLGAYYTKGFDSSSLFKGLAIEKTDGYAGHMNKHNVIYIDFSAFPGNCKSYDSYINFIWDNLYEDLAAAYGIEKSKNKSPGYLLQQTDDSFIFILDEWDSIFYKDFVTKKDKIAYLEFLKNLLKDKPYVELAYMTGVLPIAKYSSGSELNMFTEYSFIADGVFDRYFGFVENEVRGLCDRLSSVAFNDLKEWYDGYYTGAGESLFNPRSVSLALNNKLCRSYWTETGPMDEIASCIAHNVDAVRDDVVQMVSGNTVRIKLRGYSAFEQQLTNRNEILSAMVVFGFLTYCNGALRIPNRELMEKFQEVLSGDGFGEVKEIVDRSREMLEATLARDSEKVAGILAYVHDMEIPILQYNDENSLACVVTLCYLYARDFYKIEREKKSGKGFCDFIFYPLYDGDAGIILELKCDSTCEEAIQQIKDRNYAQELEDCGEILLVGINYDKKTKTHECKIEAIVNQH